MKTNLIHWILDFTNWNDKIIIDMEGCHPLPPPLPFSRFLGMTCCNFSCCFLLVSLLCCNSISSWNDTLPSLHRYLLLHWTPWSFFFFSFFFFFEERTPWLKNNNNGLLKKTKTKSLLKVGQIKDRRKNRVRQKCAKEKKKKKKKKKKKFGK